MVNQLLAHITNTPFELIAYCQEQGLAVEAYSPAAHGEALKNREITDMAQKYAVSPARPRLRYGLQLGPAVLPKSANPAHMLDNALPDFQISDGNIEALNGLEHIKDYGESSFFPVYGGKM